MRYLPFVVLLLAGCGSGTAAVTGTVVHEDGSPARELAGGVVCFDDGKHSAVGTIDAEGRFTLGTFGLHDGALPGNYRVAISQPDPDGRSAGEVLIDPRYTRFDTSGLQAEVTTGKNDFTFPLADRPSGP
ncbi:MAG: carboxypeptidase regulatory-like domain-containing protein [Gemmataceae bacterium]